jgi:hypothetical protein
MDSLYNDNNFKELYDNMVDSKKEWSLIVYNNFKESRISYYPKIINNRKQIYNIYNILAYYLHIK